MVPVNLLEKMLHEISNNNKHIYIDNGKRED